MARQLVLVRHGDDPPDDRVVSFAVMAGFEPVLVRPFKGDSLPEPGPDVAGSVIYGGPYNVFDEARHPFLHDEAAWIRACMAQGIPLLGICRGFQEINVVLGGTLHQDILHLRRRTSNRPGLLPTKRVRLEPSSLAARVCGATAIRVNSLHHQAVRLAGRGLTVVGRDRDDIVQAVECSDGRPVIGVQWHPEYLIYLPAQLALFRWLVRSAKKA